MQKTYICYQRNTLQTKVDMMLNNYNRLRKKCIYNLFFCPDIVSLVVNNIRNTTMTL